MYDTPERPSISGGLTAGTSVARQPSDIEREMMTLEEVASMLRKMVVSLGDKLSPVLRAELVSEENTGTPEEVLAPLAQAIKDRRMSIQGSVRDIDDIISRVQL